MNRQTTAIHEAGHVVAAVRLNIKYGRATILPDEESGFLGQVSCDEDYFEIELNQEDGSYNGIVRPELVERQLILCMAGYAALVAAGRSEEESMDGTGKDITDAEALLEKVPSFPLEHWKEKAVALMRLPENLKAVQRVAIQLLKDHCLGPDMLDVLVDVADGISTEEDYMRFTSIHPSGPTGCRSMDSG